jgi:hypothetical protein
MTKIEYSFRSAPGADVPNVAAMDLHPLVLLSGDAAPPGRAVSSLADAASGGCALRQPKRRSKGKGDTKMVRVTVEVREGALTYRVRIIAPSIERALEIAGAGKPSRRVHLLFPIDPEAFFVSAGSGTREAA